MKINFFDGFLILFTLLALFTVGFHLGYGKEHEEGVTFLIYAEAENGSKFAFAESEGYIDGRFLVYGIEEDNGSYRFKCDGRIGPLGFLAGGAKYLAKNQPVKILGEYSSVTLKIQNMQKYSEKWQKNSFFSKVF